jgi:hypothetical protein
VPAACGTEPRLLVALALISAAITAQQVGLMMVLGWVHWHHFAYLVVAVALLGCGLAGTVLSLARERLLAAWRNGLPWLALVAAGAMPLGVRLAQTRALAVDLPLMLAEPHQVWRFAVLCLLLLPPFFCGGLATALVLAAQARRAGIYYAASLAGAGFGGLGGLAFSALVAPPRLPASAAVFALGAAACLWPESRRNARAGAVAVALLVGAMLISPGVLRPSQFKPLNRALDLPGAHIVAERPSARGWVQVVAAPALRPAAGVSLGFGGQIPSQPAVFVNGLGYGSLPAVTAGHAPSWLGATTDAAAFAVGRSRRVLLLENGPGGWAALAADHGAGQVTVVEPNRALVNLLTEGATPRAAEWRLPPVRLAVADGREFLRSTHEEFEVIRFPTVGALGGSAGLEAASEQFLLTREAFAGAWSRLAPGGVLAVTAWMDFPERNPLRLLATLAEMLERAGAPPRTHLVAVRGWATVTFLARRPAWDAAGIAALRRFCEEHGFDPLLWPGLSPEERQANNLWQNPAFFAMVDRLVDGPREPVYRDYTFALRPTDDDRPYFAQFLCWRELGRLAAAFTVRSVPFFELGSLVVAITFVLLTVLALGGIVLPLARLGWRGEGRTGVLLYFSGLGAGFMFIEIGLMLRAQAWLGSPITSAAVVLTALLVASGGGSLWSERLTAEPRTLRRVALLVAAGALVASALLSGLGAAAYAWPAAAQVTVLLAVVGALGFAMGLAFAPGLRRLETTAPALVPWAWAINGCVSVATPAGAMLLAMNAGFGALFFGAAAAYALAGLGTALLPP